MKFFPCVIALMLCFTSSFASAASPTPSPTYTQTSAGDTFMDAVGNGHWAKVLPVVGAAISSPLNVAQVDGQKSTYNACTAVFAPATTPTDVFTLTGSATKTIRIIRMMISGYRTTATQTALVLDVRSTADTGGTSTAVTAIPSDSTNSAATASAAYYTANPSVGVLTGAVRSAFYPMATSLAASAVSPLEWDFGDKPGQSLVLRGTAQQAALNLGGTTMAGGNLYVCVEWSEE